MRLPQAQGCGEHPYYRDQDAGHGGKPTRIVRILSGDSRYFPGCNSRRTREQKLLVPDNIAALW